MLIGDAPKGAVVTPTAVLIGAPRKAGERLGDDLFSLDETQMPQAPRPTRSLQRPGSVPAVQRSRSLRKSQRDRLQGHDRETPRKNKSNMPCFVLTGAPQKAGERLGDDLLNRHEKSKRGGAGHSAKSLRDRPRHHFDKSRSAMCCADRRSLQGPGSA